MKKYIILIVALFFAAINFNLFLKTLNLVTGGTQGLAIVIKHLIKVKPSLIIFIINIISLIISFIFLKKETTTSAIVSTFTYPLLVRLTSFIPELSFIKEHILTSSLLAGMICGTTGGIIYKMNFSSGGITVINLIFKKYFKLKVSISNFIINSLIIIIGTFFFGILKMFYSLIVISISSFIIDIITKNKLTKNKT